MPIYTKGGDKGKTSLYGGKRVSKTDPQVEAYGSVDELSSFIGLVASKSKPNEQKILLDLQKDLYKIMSYLSGANLDLGFLDLRMKEFENEIDQIDKKLPKLTRFILPGGNELSAWFHILRVICRRSERKVIKYYSSLKIKKFKFEIIRYLNRLSDYFFILARSKNKGKDVLT